MKYRLTIKLRDGASTSFVIDGRDAVFELAAQAIAKGAAKITIEPLEQAKA